MILSVFINPEASYRPYLSYVLQLIGQNKGIEFDLDARTRSSALLVFDHSSADSLPVAHQFYLRLDSLDSLEHSKIFDEKPLIYDSRNRIDYLATIFYLVNCLQEYTVDDSLLDQYMRFKYENSVQKRFDVVTKNLVQEYIDAFLDANAIQYSESAKSRVFLSHDIDLLYGSLLSDGLWALKRGRLDIVFKVILNEILGKPGWKNIDRVLSIQSEYDLRSTFFWLVSDKKGMSDIENADYNLMDEKGLTQLVADSNFPNGLHKGAMGYTINEELAMLPFECNASRYHFLRFGIRSEWPEVSRSSLELDASLGFAEQIGFRNSYGQPFQPFDIKNKQLFNFVEMPLHVMDATLHKYMKVPIDRTADTVIDFFEMNSRGCVLSLLWHNNYFTDYKFSGYLSEYKTILAYLRDSEYVAITPDEIVQEYRLG